MQFLPLIFLGLIIFFSTMSARARRQQEEARKAAMSKRQYETEQQAAAAKPEQKPVAYKPEAKPAPKPQAPKTPPPKKTVPAYNPQAQRKTETVSRVTDRIVKENKQPVEEKKTDGQPAPGPVLPPLKWNRSAAMQGIVYAEILGKPKALRHK